MLWGLSNILMVNQHLRMFEAIPVLAMVTDKLNIKIATHITVFLPFYNILIGFIIGMIASRRNRVIYEELYIEAKGL